MDSTIKEIVFQESRLVSSVPVIYSEVWFPFAFGFFFFAFLFPALRALFQVVVLGTLKLGLPLWQRGRKWARRHVAAVRATVAALFVVTLVVAGASVWLLREADRTAAEERKAKQVADEAAAVDG